MYLLDKIWEELVKNAPLTDLNHYSEVPNHLKKRGAVVGFEGQAVIEGQSVLIQIGLDAEFPRSLPQIFLMPWCALGFIPHIARDGNICYAHKEGLFLNRHAPIAIIREAIERSLHVLTQGVRGENHYDFVEEFEAYWLRLQEIKIVPSSVEPGDTVCKITSIINPEQESNIPTALTRDPSIDLSYLALSSSGNYVHHNAFYVPFEKDFFLKPPRHDSPWSLENIQEIVQRGLSHQNHKQLRRLGAKCKQEQSVVFSVPRLSGSAAMFGAHFVGIQGRSPLLSGGTAHTWIPLFLNRYDKEYLLPRGGANLVLRQKRVAILGCGSVGGFLALELARAGILNLALVDPDKLSPNNTFRHTLGMSSWARPKVLALQEEIKDKLPYTHVETFEERGEEIIRRRDFKLSDYDLVISAIGDDTINLHLNQIFHSSKAHAPPIIFTWLEPYGIGGHALVSRGTHSSGCLECLFTPTEDDRDYALCNRAAFAAAGQSFVKIASGCGSPFTPYSSSAALKTAMLAAELAIKVLLGKEMGNPLVSWKGSADELLRAGFRVSDRYSMSVQQLFERRYNYQNPHCLVCGTKT